MLCFNLSLWTSDGRAASHPLTLHVVAMSVQHDNYAMALYKSFRLIGGTRQEARDELTESVSGGKTY